MSQNKATKPEHSAELIRAKINAETAQIPWKDLQRFFAAGDTMFVKAELDLIDVAFAFNQDQAKQVEDWINQALVVPVTTEQARQWLEKDRQLWAVVVKPWVLLQLPN